MSILAQQLIAQNKSTKNSYLDLGNCGLTELPTELFECVWLEELILTNGTGNLENKREIEGEKKSTKNNLTAINFTE